MKKSLMAALSILILVILISEIWRYTTTLENCRETSGIVSTIEEAGAKDLVVKLHGNDTVFYINRGFGSNSALAHQSGWVGKKVILKYNGRSSILGKLLNTDQKPMKQVYAMRVGQSMVYTIE